VRIKSVEYRTLRTEVGENVIPASGKVNRMPPLVFTSVLAEEGVEGNWDINAKAVNLPLYKYLGACRDKIRGYASTVAYPTITSAASASTRAACRTC
jgi:hypothetical protein